MSAGSRSGVNCTRENDRPAAVAIDRAVSVLATPGTSSSSTWPSASSPAMISSNVGRLPTIALLTSSITARTSAAASVGVRGGNVSVAVVGGFTGVRPPR